MIFIPHTFSLKLFGGFSITILSWFGLDNPNTCLIDGYNTHGNGKCRNVGFTILPLRFWEHFFFEKKEFGHNNIRTSIGIGLFSVYWDSPINEK